MEKDIFDKNEDTPYMLLDFPAIKDPRGNLSFVEGARHVPFDIQRVYYLYDVPGGAQRGGHAHRGLQQVLIALSGSFDVVLHDGRETHRVSLNHPGKGLFISQMTWRELENFSSGSVCLVLASAYYEEDDYIRDFEAFLQAKGS
jgi:dTDP-4-dehydrorhamnose 3,5-epimerase-like enzyme